jgi:hypothetical protein
MARERATRHGARLPVRSHRGKDGGMDAACAPRWPARQRHEERWGWSEGRHDSASQWRGCGRGKGGGAEATKSLTTRAMRCSEEQHGVLLGVSALSRRGVGSSSPWLSALCAAGRATASTGLCCCVSLARVVHGVAKDLCCMLACGVYT